MPLIRIAAVLPVTDAEGPGARFAVWLQGCVIRCPGCCNPHMFDPAGGEAIEPGPLLASLDAARGQVEGVTLLGGEPFDQAGALLPFARGARARGLSLVAFSGYRIEELRRDAPPGARDLLAELDLLVDGPYVASLPEARRRWAGSENQRFHYLTGRYAPGVEVVLPGEPDRIVELRVGLDGRLLRSGWPET